MHFVFPSHCETFKPTPQEVEPMDQAVEPTRQEAGLHGSAAVELQEPIQPAGLAEPAGPAEPAGLAELAGQGREQRCWQVPVQSQVQVPAEVKPHAQVPASGVIADVRFACVLTTKCAVPADMLLRVLDCRGSAADVDHVKDRLHSLCDGGLPLYEGSVLRLLLEPPFAPTGASNAFVALLSRFIAKGAWQMVLHCLRVVDSKWPSPNTTICAGFLTPQVMCASLDALTQAVCAPPDVPARAAIMQLGFSLVNLAACLNHAGDVLTALCRLWVVSVRRLVASGADMSFRFGAQTPDTSRFCIYLLGELQRMSGADDKYAAALMNVDGIDCVCDMMQKEQPQHGSTAPEVTKALWTMSMLLPDDEFRDFLDARAGFARKLLLSFALPSGTGPFVDASRTERADGGSLAPFLHAHHRMFILDSAAAEAANASLRAQLAVTQESLEHALADVASAHDRAAAFRRQVAHAGERATAAEERATAAEERAAAAEEWTTLAEERAAVAQERAAVAEERVARVQQAAEQRVVHADLRTKNSARLVATMLDTFRTNVHSALGLQ